MSINKVIRWKLNEVMARKRIKNKDLAQKIGITETSIYRLRKVDEMPRLSPERLNGICAALSCQPGDLLVYEPDTDGDVVSIVDVA
ncbi:transcriptional regulator [Calothrix sp. HK-06]|nr:transcriptional regulator [Calothrix sp. HK-06]